MTDHFKMYEHPIYPQEVFLALEMILGTLLNKLKSVDQGSATNEPKGGHWWAQEL